MTKHVDGLRRRQFLVGSASVGAGLMFGFSLGTEFSGGANKAFAAGNYDHGLFLTMDPTGITTVNITKCEGGQHIGTAIAQMVVEQLELDWNDVRIAYVDSHEKWGLMITGGSWSVNWTFDQMSRVGASARIALVDAGAKMLGVSPSECSAANSVVTHEASGTSVTYGDIVSSGNIDRTFTEDEMKELPLKGFGDYKVVGQSMPALDIPSKTDGTAGFGIDVFVPGMVYARWLSPPVRWGAMPKSVNDSAAKSVDGYIGTILAEGSGNAGAQKGYALAIAETKHAADAAADLVKVQWDLGPYADVSDETLVNEAKSLIDDPNSGLAWVLDGDVKAGLSGASVTHEAEYTTSILSHACMEPMNCVAMEQDGQYHIFMGCQWATRVCPLVAEAVGVDPADVIIHHQYAGGFFGRRLDADEAIPAALAAKELGRPVKLIFTRENDIQFDFHRTPTVQRIKGGVDADGKYVAIDHAIAAGWSTKRTAPGFLAESVDKKGKIDGFSNNGSDFWYTVPNHHVRAIENELATQALPPGFVRSVAPGWTFFAVESYIDEMARKVGKDPLMMRVDMLDAVGKNAGSPPNSVGGAKRLRNVLMAAAGRAGFGTKVLGENIGMGLSCVSAQERGSPTWSACVAEVHVDPASGEPTVKKLTIVMDVGTVVNPDGALSQIEGSALWGVSHALLERATMSNGGIDQTNFDTYEVLRMSDVPEIDIVLVQNGNYPAGIGEPATALVPASIANAIDDAVGARVRSVPITADAIKAAMA